MLKFILRKILRRPHFKGQDRLFNFLFKRNLLNQGLLIVKPIIGNFKINCATRTWIGAKIVYLGDYEPFLKKIFKDQIHPAYTILDIGANIGFHTLYFAELTGEKGKVISFEPVPLTFESLNNNIKLNNFTNIYSQNIALSNKNEKIFIAADSNSTNPGAFNLFDQSGNIEITCCIGDEIIKEEKIDFMKIDVEGYESFVIDGLFQTIKKYKPKIIFEYDPNYHLKTNLPEDHIFSVLSSLNYHFFCIQYDGLKSLHQFKNIRAGNFLALPND